MKGRNEDLEKALLESFGRTGRDQVNKELKEGKLKLITGTDQATGKDRFLLEKNDIVSLGDDKYLMAGKVVTTDPLKIARWVFNHLKQEIFWKNLSKEKRPHIIHPAEKWIIVPDHYYSPHLKKDFSDKDDPIKLTEKMLGSNK